MNGLGMSLFILGMWEPCGEATGLMVEYWGKWAHHQLHIRTVSADPRPQHLTQSLGRLSTSWITARTKSTTRDGLGIKFESNQKVKQTNKSQSSWSSGCVVTNSSRCCSTCSGESDSYFYPQLPHQHKLHINGEK